MTSSITNDTNLLRSKKLSELIRHEIQIAGGIISFARFMELALYAPELGYYSAGSQIFGSEGDFITAPQISPLFTQCLARQFQPVLTELDEADILEIGAGSGIFAKDILLSLEKLNNLPRNYFIFEISPTLRQQQQTFLQTSCPHLLARVQWIDSLPKEFRGIIFANEVMDAMPVHCFRVEEIEIKERGVTWDQDQFRWQTTTPCKELSERLELLQQEFHLPTGYESEINLGLSKWISSLANCLKEGVIILFDYGYGRGEYYHPDRNQGTLMCFYQHHSHSDPFLHVGLQDITAHVDFTSVAESAIDANLSLAGYTTQATFLLACGLLDLAESHSPVEQYQQSQSIKKLTLPSQMGELVKVIGLSKNFDSTLIGFTLHDRRRNL